MSMDPEHGIPCRSAASLRLTQAQSEPLVADLRPGRNRIGRAETNDIAVNHPSVSQAHCEIHLSKENASVRDLGSTNGTFLDDESVQEGMLRAGQRLRLGEVEFVFERSVPAEPVMQSPPPTSPSPGSEIQAGLCVNHTSRATWVCTECGRHLCAACVKQVKLEPKKTLAICRACDGLCQRLAGRGAGFAPQTFYGGMRAALAYPLQTVGLILLAAVAVLNLLTGIASASFATGGLFLLLGLGAAAYILVYLRQVLLSATDNEAVMPDFPEFDSHACGEVALQFIGVYLVCFGPWTLCTAWLRPETEAMKIACHALLGLGAFYFPMALLAVVLWDNLAALNPLLVLISIVNTFIRYIAMCFFFAALASPILLIDRALNTLGSPTLASTVSSTAGLYAVLVALRVLGWFYYCNRERLGWR